MLGQRDVMLYVPVETLRLYPNPFSDLKLIGGSAEELGLGGQGELLVTASSYPTARDSHGQQHYRNGQCTHFSPCAMAGWMWQREGAAGSIKRIIAGVKGDW